MGLGSNRPWGGIDPLSLLNAAAGDLADILGALRLSPFYKTAPLYVADQGPFFNAAAAGMFSGTARELLAHTADIEARHGRNRAAERRWGERSLDIDILLFGPQVLNEPGLIIPHPRLPERAFALRPLLDLLPDAAEPGTGRAYKTLLAALSDQKIEALAKTALPASPMEGP